MSTSLNIGCIKNITPDNPPNQLKTSEKKVLESNFAKGIENPTIKSGITNHE
ncbi:MAG: hypothetical protein VZR10_09545 [Methanobrevibacter sp.]|nr:hypothetical protein [Methanobrevibacter sp.]